MHCTDLAKLPTNQVMALFADSVILFSLSKGATFADLADRLDHLAERHTGMPTAIYLKVAWPGARFLPVNPDPVPRSIPEEEATDALELRRALDPDQRKA